MPKGVEHVACNVFPGDRWEEFLPLMPKGVEHKPHVAS